MHLVPPEGIEPPATDPKSVVISTSLRGQKFIEFFLILTEDYLGAQV